MPVIEARMRRSQRGLDDKTFRDQIGVDPDAALRSYDLSRDERDAVIAGDEGKLRALGVEERLSKAVRAH